MKKDFFISLISFCTDIIEKEPVDCSVMVMVINNVVDDDVITFCCVDEKIILHASIRVLDQNVTIYSLLGNVVCVVLTYNILRLLILEN
jgi:hypothetical protein